MDRDQAHRASRLWSMSAAPVILGSWHIRGKNRGSRVAMTEEKQAGNSWQELVRSTWHARAAEWDQMAEAHALSEDRTADIARLAVALDLHHGSTVLDAGCGTGQLAIAFATLGCRVTAQDLAPAMIDRAQMHARDRGVEITFRVGDITDLPDERNTYDAVHARVVLQFVRNPVTALQQ